MERRADFWKAVVDELGIVFRDEGSVVLDASAGPQRARWWPDASMNIVESCFRHDPDRPAVVYRRRGALSALSYGDLSHRVAEAAARFSAGDVVGIVAPMSIETVVAYLGIVAAGGTVVSIPESFSADEIGRRLRIAGAERVLTQDVIVRGGRRIALYERVADAARGFCAVVRIDPLESAGPVGRACTESVARPAGHPINILFSSGTTGEPKAIPWTHLTPIKGAMDARLHFDVGPEDVLCWPSSLGWMMGPWLVFASLLNGAAFALYDDVARGRSFGSFVRDAGVTMLGVVPSLVASWRASACMQGLDWTRIRRFTSTGEASNPDDMAYLSSLAGGRPIIEYIGGTEIGGGYLTSTLTEPSWPSEFNTPALGLDVVILDESGRASDEGELYLVPPSVGLSAELLNRDHDEIYYADLPRDGLRRHGDYVARTERGTYRALGRADDTMNLGGIKVSSGEIERAVLRVEGVREAAAVAWPSPGGGAERLAIFLVPEPGDVDVDDWRRRTQDAISGHLNPLFRVERVVVVDALPRTASNKVMRRRLRERLIDRG